MKHCEHLKSNGHFCGSPALRGRSYCYFHLTHIGRKLRAEKQAQRNPNQPPNFELPMLEDAASIQLALMQVSDAVLQGTLDPKRAGLVLYALQTASINLQHMADQAQAEDLSPTCNQYESFEQDYGLDDSIDLCQPEPVLDPSPAAAAQRVLDDAQAVGLKYPAPAPGDEKGDKDEPYPWNATWNPPGFFTDPDILSFQFPPKPGDPPPAPEEYNPGVPIPAFLTRKQYEQARVALFGYEKRHRITHQDPGGLKALRERPALSQKIFLESRKPPVSAPAEQDTAAPSKKERVLNAKN